MVAGVVDLYVSRNGCDEDSCDNACDNDADTGSGVCDAASDDGGVESDGGAY